MMIGLFCHQEQKNIRHQTSVAVVDIYVQVPYN